MVELLATSGIASRNNVAVAGCGFLEAEALGVSATDNDSFRMNLSEI
jgi:hypothetical protein